MKVSKEDSYLMSDFGANTFEGIIDGLKSSNFDFLDGVPVVSLLKTVYKIGHSMQERKFMEKVLSFMNASIETDSKERAQFLLDYYYADKEKFGSRILTIIDKLDSNLKSVILARLASSLIQKKITVSGFNRLANCIIMANIEDLKFLLQHKGKERNLDEQFKGDEYFHLSLVGLTYINKPSGSRYGVGSASPSSPGENPFYMMDLTYDLIEFGLYHDDFK